MASTPPRHPHRQPWRQRLSTAFATRTAAYRSRSMAWRLLAPTVFVLAGVLFVTSMVSSQGTDLRAGRDDDLDGPANSQARDPAATPPRAGLANGGAGAPAGIGARAGAVKAESTRLSGTPGRGGGSPAGGAANGLSGPAGLKPVTGPGVTITLDDAPDEALQAAGDDV